MSAVVTLYRSSIGKKAIMAVTGIVLVGFVVVHMLGNLKIFTGATHFNEYAHFLRTVGEPALPYGTVLWIARLVLLASVGLHILAAVQLTRMDWAGRPQRYAVKKITTSYAARTMRWGGVILLLFIIYHILHFTLGAVGYSAGQFQEGEVYNNVLAGFRVWYVSAFYIAAMVALGFHLYHGVWSMLQTLGINRVRSSKLFQGFAALVALAVVIGNISIPVAVLAGWLA